MTLKEQLKYQPYEHKYKEDNVLVLKSVEDLNKINNILIDNENPDAFLNANWYLTNEKMTLLCNKKLKVISCISWHMGIAFYSFEGIKDKSVILYIGEFYLNKQT